MAETLLKKEFDERGLQRIRNLISKKYDASTGVQVGYIKKTEDHEEGDIWEEDNRTWTIKNGIKQTYTKLDTARQAGRIPFSCPCCKKRMKTDHDKKMYPIHGKCFDCVIVFESQLKREGKYEAYMQQFIKGNILTLTEEAEQFIDHFAKSEKETFVTDDGDIEEMDGDVDKEKMIAAWKKELAEMKTFLQT